MCSANGSVKPIAGRERFGSRVISTIETYDLVGKVKALTSVGAFLYYITIPILPYKLISVSIDFEIKKEHYCL